MEYACMTEAQRRNLRTVPDPAFPYPIGHWLWVLADTRQRTLEALDGLDEGVIDRLGPGGNTIGTILAHIAAVETSWLYDEIVLADYPEELLDYLPPTMRDADGHLFALPGTPLTRYLAGLEIVRDHLVRTIRGLTVEDLHRPRSLPQYDVTPDWVLHHLVQHEAEHRAELAVARTVLEGSRP
jgi:uncharacterized damage-inducible protein DinB